MPRSKIHEDIINGYKGDDAHRKRCLKTIKDNLDSGAYKDLNVLDGNETPLMSVATGFDPNSLEYHLEIAKMLLKSPKVKEHVNTKQDGTGDTALHKAAISGMVKIAKLLIEFGANVEIKDVHGKTAADIVNESSNEKKFPEFEKALRNPKKAKWNAAIQEQKEEVKRHQKGVEEQFRARK